MSGRAPRGRGFRGRFRGGRGRRGAPAQDHPEEVQTGDAKFKPEFTKIANLLKPANVSYNVVARATSIELESNRTQNRRGGVATVPCSKALIGDDTGCIALTVSQRHRAKAELLKDNELFVFLNVRLRQVGDQRRLEVDQWGDIKPLEDAKDILPTEFTPFEMNAGNDLSKKQPPKPAYTKIEALEPETRGHNLVVKVLNFSVEERSRIDGSRSKVAEATVGDETGIVTMIARSEGHINALREGSIIAVYNAHIEMYNPGFMRLIVDRWADLKPLEVVPAEILPSPHVTEATEIKVSANKSAVEYVLQDD